MSSQPLEEEEEEVLVDTVDSETDVDIEIYFDSTDSETDPDIQIDFDSDSESDIDEPTCVPLPTTEAESTLDRVEEPVGVEMDSNEWPQGSECPQDAEWTQVDIPHLLWDLDSDLPTMRDPDFPGLDFEAVDLRKFVLKKRLHRKTNSLPPMGIF